MRPGFPYRLYLVISPSCCDGRNWLQVAAAALAGGVDVVQFRDKHSSDDAFRDAALRLKELTDRAAVPLIINDRTDIAKAVNAAGVHVGNSDKAPTAIRSAWPGCGIIGSSIEYLEQLGSPDTAAADYLGVSPVFRTATKTDTVTEWGLEGIARIRHATGKPLVAIGNINAGNAAETVRAGADCLAVVSAICAAPDPCRAAAEIRKAIERSL